VAVEASQEWQHVEHAKALASARRADARLSRNAIEGRLHHAMSGTVKIGSH
jgi:hypothetical protein